MKTTPKLFSIFLLAFLFTIQANNCKAQQSDMAYYKHNKLYYWLEANGGYTTMGNTIGGSVNIRRNGYVMAFNASDRFASATATKQAPLNLAVTGGFELFPGKFNNVTVSAGFEISTKVQAGYQYDDYYTNYLSSANDIKRSHYREYGMPVEVKYLNNTGFAGIAGFSLAATAHLDSGTPYFSATLGIGFGKLREAKP